MSLFGAVISGVCQVRPESMLLLAKTCLNAIFNEGANTFI